MVSNITHYVKTDIIRAFLLIKENVSRNELVSKLALGEGSVRTILDVLKDKNLIYSTKKGHSLTEKGILVFKKIEKSISVKKLILGAFYPGLEKAIVLLNKTDNNIKISFEQRDIAVRQGAEGAVILKFDKELYIPNADINFKENYKKAYDEILKRFDFKKGNILIVCFAKSLRNAENGALEIALSMSKELNNLIKMFIP
ncbi:hypothetical protein COY26_04190 [Candidatus Woesearchaeota archaeon CG_4_10_14_0_2_um_filter_33_10]|nr:MAG: hypothetical protein AUJ83_02265 [Candidatus Woesearchaeota archaeon CG1_02_33_12]PIN78713.1 MAG: hypothetical protein COV14_02765 [Candidatus Woesearchaeota archaeon CG10_big_fil_rev_8_21_14_0_10_33_12]PIZ52593.1 MAG: hypothetical protein COY26_04190 [Candidatus Woesearchaeota archaeon CG_4_10_14_0_2_um_filter_33_10]